MGIKDGFIMQYADCNQSDVNEREQFFFKFDIQLLQYYIANNKYLNIALTH